MIFVSSLDIYTVVRVGDFYISPVSSTSEGVLSDPSTSYYFSIDSLSYVKISRDNVALAFSDFWPLPVLLLSLCISLSIGKSSYIFSISSFQFTFRCIFFFTSFLNKINHLLNLLSYILSKDLQSFFIPFFFSGTVLISTINSDNVVRIVLIIVSQQLVFWHLLLDLNYWWGIFGALGYIS